MKGRGRSAWYGKDKWALKRVNEKYDTFVTMSGHGVDFSPKIKVAPGKGIYDN